MNVIKVQRPQRRPNNVRLLRGEIRKLRIPSDFVWHGVAEIFLFGVISLISIWPVFDAMDAVLRLR
jgi:hypothetical protein